MDCFVPASDANTRILNAVVKDGYDDWLATQSDAVKDWIAGVGFKAKPGAAIVLPDASGKPSHALLILETEADLWSWGGAARSLPAGRYQIDPDPTGAEAAGLAALGWALGSYSFDRYRKREDAPRELVWPGAANQTEVMAVADGVYLIRDLVTTPASDMGPAELAGAADTLAQKYGAICRHIIGDDLLAENFPMVHAVGRASTRAPRLIDLTWGASDHPKVTLVGKGVVFDTGGLDLKPSSGMLMMKKDMGGAAQVLGLAQMIMATGLPVRLRVLIPAVENSVSGNAFRPLDILPTRKGLTVEVGNTDAEGRLVLGDALAYACEESPDMLIDFATLTGAARVALGTDLPAQFCNSDALAQELIDGATTAQDPVWRLPLHKPYASMLDSKIADTNNVSAGGYAGAITAALFLENFVTTGTDWAHYDLMSWNVSSKPGRPEGGEAQATRGVFAAIRNRFG